MKRIYTYGGEPAERNLTLACLQENKRNGVKMVQVSAITQAEAAACERLGVDMITISDNDIEAVRRGAPNTFVTGSQTMTAYMNEDDALSAAVKTMEKGADAIFTPRGLATVERIANEGIAVQGHVGLVPRKSSHIGGLRTFGKTAAEAMALFEDMKRFEDAGGFAVEVECVAVEALEAINLRTTLLTHSIGAGSAGDIIFSFMEDITGDVDEPPRHAKAWADMLAIRRAESAERDKGIVGFRDAVRDGSFPDAEHTVSMIAGEHERLLEALHSWSSPQQ